MTRARRITRGALLAILVMLGSACGSSALATDGPGAPADAEPIGADAAPADAAPADAAPADATPADAAVPDAPPPLCTPGATRSCYSGPPATEGVGVCVAGTEECLADGSAFGPCVGEVTPGLESCTNDTDDDCDGLTNEEGDGCVCLPDSTEACYTGPSNTRDVGVCRAGTRTCNHLGTEFGPCSDVTPGVEDCATPADEDCDGATALCPAGAARVMGAAGDQTARALAVTAAGDLVVAGDFAGSVDFGGGVLTSAGNLDAFVARYDAAGNHLWSQRFGDASAQSILGVAVDPQGNVLVTGYFQGTVNFGGGNLTTAGLADVFVAKLDAAGAHLWSKRFGSASDDQLGLAVAVAPDGTVCVGGSFTGSLTFGGATLTSAGGADAFVVRLDAAGNHLASRRFGDAADQAVRAVAAGASQIVIAGDLGGTVDFGGGPLASGGGLDAFVVGLDATLAHQFGRVLGGPGYQTATAVALDATGAVTVGGAFEGVLDIGGASHEARGGLDAWVARLDAAGTPTWSRRFGGSQLDAATSVAADATGGVLLGGYFAQQADFGPAVFAEAILDSQGGRDAFLARLDPQGETIWARRLGDAAFYQSVMAVAFRPDGGAAAAGYFAGSMDFGAGAITSAGGLDAFVAAFPPP